MRLAAAFTTLFFLAIPARAAAQECRRTCNVDETRDANGCCVAAARTVPGPAAPAAVGAVRCPAGTSWSESRHVCVGRLVCPAGSHPEPGRGCVSDPVGCPTGSRLEGDRCVADITCPANTEMHDNVCIAQMSCPAGTRLENGQCVSADVQCPAGTSHRPGVSGCVGDPQCPAGTQFTAGQGCVGGVVCPPGSHRQGSDCVQDVACLEGTHHVEGHGCVDVCLDFPHSHWTPERRTCECEHNFVPHEGRCEPGTGCEVGMHMEGSQCVPDVVCPYGFTLVRERAACVDLRAEELARRTIERRRRLAEAAAREQAQAEAAQREAAHQASLRRWAWGPALQVYGGYGYFYYALPNTFQRVTAPTDRFDLAWQGFAPTAGISFSSEGLVFGARWTYVPLSVPSTVSLTVNGSQPWLNLIEGEIGIQIVAPIHSARVTFVGGADIGGYGVTAGLSYRSLFRIIAGLFVGVEVRGGVFYRYGGVPGTYSTSTTPTSNLIPSESHVGYDVGGDLFVGYSIH